MVPWERKNIGHPQKPKGMLVKKRRDWATRKEKGPAGGKKNGGNVPRGTIDVGRKPFGDAKEGTEYCRKGLRRQRKKKRVKAKNRIDKTTPRAPKKKPAEGRRKLSGKKKRRKKGFTRREKSSRGETATGRTLSNRGKEKGGSQKKRKTLLERAEKTWERNRSKGEGGYIRINITSLVGY